MAPLGLFSFFFFCLSLSFSSLHHIVVCLQMAVPPNCLFIVWNKSLEKLEVSPVSECSECKPHLRWPQDRLLWRRNPKCPNVEDFLWRCSNLYDRILQLCTQEESARSGRETLKCESLNRGKWGDSWASCLMVTSSTDPQLHSITEEVSEAHLPMVLLSPPWTPQP